ncbi:hypothetical protein LTR36_004785 [Oleoguttula mirabilis]|uniref:Uncharacterized protein n=1 Tax=Oleoguttula mirabilis TaxID=1507867 RepID=A0AAV9JG39_9PEZI|nr:hypothetical protein LTR36_004785 [Oleoguttula mirabilis]
MAATTPDKKKNRLSNMFGSKREPDRPPPHQAFPSHSSNGNMQDSAYESSLGNSTAESNMQHIESNDDRNLALNKTTGEVIDEDTGATVITTTTTTTTTTITRNGKKESRVEIRSTTPTPRGDSSQQTTIAEAPGDNQHLSPADANGTTRREVSHTPQERLATLSHSPYPTGQQQQQQQQAALPIPHRNPNRKSLGDERPPQQYFDGANASAPSEGPVSPSSPSRANFSYPSRSTGNLRGQAGEEGAPAPVEHRPGVKGTFESLRAAAMRGQGGGGGEGEYGAEPGQRVSAFENLKAAAVGIHGVGETLRSTLNSEIDNRYPRRDPEKAAAAEAKNRAEMERGYREMAGLRQRADLGPTISRPGQSGDGAALTPTTSRPGQSNDGGVRRPSNPSADIPASLQPGGGRGGGGAGAPQLPLLPGQAPPDLRHPAFRDQPQQQQQQQPQQQQKPPPQPQDGRYYGPGQNIAPDHDPMRDQKGARYSSMQQPSEPQATGGAAMGNSTKVQALSQTGTQQQEEKEKKGGFRRLMKRKPASQAT